METYSSQISVLYCLTKNKFNPGKLVMFKSKRKFSPKVIHQANEQVQAIIKGDGCAIKITDNSSARRLWVVSGTDLDICVQTMTKIFWQRCLRGVDDHEQAKNA